MSESYSQGKEATHNGTLLEGFVGQHFRSRKVLVVPYSQSLDNHDMFARKRLISQVPYINHMRSKARRDFVYYHDPLIPIHIECKGQQGPGSVSEKLHVAFYNAVECSPGMNAWLIIEGDGFPAAAVKWLREECKKVDTKVVRFLTLSDLPRAVKSLVENGQP